MTSGKTINSKNTIMNTNGYAKPKLYYLGGRDFQLLPERRNNDNDEPVSERVIGPKPCRMPSPVADFFPHVRFPSAAPSGLDGDRAAAGLASCQHFRQRDTAFACCFGGSVQARSDRRPS